MSSVSQLRERWRYLFRERLPNLASVQDAVQKSWPVRLDHCFARIILDNAVGEDRPWHEVVRTPAIHNMTADQLERAISLAEKIATGEEDLARLDQQSLQLRGKSKKRKRADYSESTPSLKKNKMLESTLSAYFTPIPLSSVPTSEASRSSCLPDSTKDCDADMAVQLHRIATSDITPFRKQTLSLLCKIPRGRYSTYGDMAAWITEHSHKTCARAVGNAMRNNPFAPHVPCHRVLAGDGSLGGFGGSWGEEGKYAKLKHELLHDEGVRFDSRGKVKGPPFRDFA